MTGRDRSVFIVVAAIVAIGAAWLMVISPKRDQATKLQGEVNHARSVLSAARAATAQSEAAKQSFRASYATLVRLGEAVPTDDNVPSLIYQVQSAATKAGVGFLSLSVTPGGAAGAPTPPTPASTSSTGATSSASSTTPAASATPAASSSSSAAAPALPPGVVVGPASFPVEPFTFTFQGSFFHLSNFFARLQRYVVATDKQLAVRGRLLSLNAISLAPGSKGFPQILATVSATTYLLPANQGLVDGATAAGPAATSGSPPASSTSSPAAAPPAAVVTSGGAG